MQEDPPAVAPPPQHPPAPTAKSPAAWQAVSGFARRTVHAVFNWPGGRWPVPTVTSLFVVSILIVGLVELLPKGASDVTLTVRARTEVLEFDLDPRRQYVWWLPAGSYSLLTAKDEAGCEQRNRFDLACTFAGPSALTIKNGATVRFEVINAVPSAGAPRFSVALTPRHGAPVRTRAATDGSAKVEASSFEIRDGADEARVATNDLVTFESAGVEQWRIPLILKRVQIGEFLTESIATTDTLGAVRQPIMTEGDVRIFARSFGLHDRYQVQEERFDPADVVQIPADQGRDGLLLGLLSLDAAGQHAFDLTLHTDLAEVFVRRLGAEHRIGVSMWLIVSKLPMWLALWIVLVSLIVVANYYSDRLGEMRGQKDEAQN
jgi:hypothetical protein